MYRASEALLWKGSPVLAKVAGVHPPSVPYLVTPFTANGSLGPVRIYSQLVKKGPPITSYGPIGGVHLVANSLPGIENQANTTMSPMYRLEPSRNWKRFPVIFV